MTAALDVRGVTRRYGSLVAADEVSFRVEPGQICGFIGPNGAGKTTTMRICATLDLPDAGDVFVDGNSVLEEPRAVRKRLGFMPDSYGAYSATTVGDYLDFFARAYGLRGRQRRRTIESVMDFTALGPLAGKETTALSKGMKQRLCLAKTLLHDPALLILDEPAAGLDPRARVELRELVKALAAMGKAVLISSHILAELGEMCHTVAVIERGTIKATGTVADIVRAMAAQTQIHVQALVDDERLERFLLEQPRVQAVRPARAGLEVDYEGTREESADLLAALVRAELKPVEFASKEVDLEDVFLSLTEGQVQ